MQAASKQKATCFTAMSAGSRSTPDGTIRFRAISSPATAASRSVISFPTGSVPDRSRRQTTSSAATSSPRTQATATASANYGEVGSAQWSGNVYDPLNLGSRSFVVTTAGVSTAKRLAQWQAAGYDAGAIVGNPMFVNPATGDYTMAAGSAALAQGIENVPISQMGLLGSSATIHTICIEPRIIDRAWIVPAGG